MTDCCSSYSNTCMYSYIDYIRLSNLLVRYIPGRSNGFLLRSGYLLNSTFVKISMASSLLYVLIIPIANLLCCPILKLLIDMVYLFTQARPLEDTIHPLSLPQYLSKRKFSFFVFLSLCICVLVK